MTAVPKTRKDTEKNKEGSEKLEPESWTSKANDALPVMLTVAAKARTLSIKLGTVEYAGELSKQLLGHASKLEKLYHKLQQAVKDHACDKILKGLFQQIVPETTFGEKAQARWPNGISHDGATLKFETTNNLKFTMGSFSFCHPQPLPSALQFMSSACEAAADAFLKVPGKKRKGAKAKAKKKEWSC